MPDKGKKKLRAEVTELTRTVAHHAVLIRDLQDQMREPLEELRRLATGEDVVVWYLAGQYIMGNTEVTINPENGKAYARDSAKDPPAGRTPRGRAVIKGETFPAIIKGRW